MSQLAVYSDDELILGIKNSNKEILIFIYKNYYPKIEGVLLKQLGCNSECAKDVFQDALISIYTKVCSKQTIKIQYSFLTFLITLCKRRMIDKIRHSTFETNNHDCKDVVDEELDIIEILNKEERFRLFDKHFKQLGEKCRDILTLFLKGHTISEITIALKMSSEMFTKKRRLQCKISLFKSLYTDPELKELINGKPWTIREIPRW